LEKEIEGRDLSFSESEPASRNEVVSKSLQRGQRSEMPFSGIQGMSKDLQAFWIVFHLYPVPQLHVPADLLL